MKLYTRFEDIDFTESSAIALGNFDGVHKGHQELIRRTVNSAIEKNLKSLVFTFTNHPRNFMSGNGTVKNILYWEEKVKTLGDLGLDYIIAIPFDKRIRDMEPEKFISEILVKKLKMKEAYCGFDYHFGKNGDGNPELLTRAGSDKGFKIHVLEPYMIRGEIVSSSTIRKYIEDGRVEMCSRLMGHCYGIKGIVVEGNRFGRTLGFPTLNVTIDEEMVSPANGVYVSYCNYNGTRYSSITNVGSKPTVSNSKTRNVETHLFNFSKEIYGKKIRVEFLERLRPEIAFKTVEELALQIKKDCLTAANYHAIIRC